VSLRLCGSYKIVGKFQYQIMPRFYNSGCHLLWSTYLQAQLKIQTMKLSKSLLSAILIGIAVQTTSSCKKDKELSDSKAKQEAAKKEAEKNNVPDPCPACGMG
jgi:hypothetical protein